MCILSNLSKRRKFQCPYCKELVVNLPRHLKSKKHNLPKDLARNCVNRWYLRKPYEYHVLKQTKTIRAEKKKKKKKKDTRTPKECPKCLAVVKRLDEHLAGVHKMHRDKQYYDLLKTARPFHETLEKHNFNFATRICPTNLPQVYLNHSENITSKPFNNLHSDIRNSRNFGKVKTSPFKVLRDAAVSTLQPTPIHNPERPALSSSDIVTDPDRDRRFGTPRSSEADDPTYKPTIEEIHEDRDSYNSFMLNSKLEEIILHFLQYLKSVDSCQVKAKEIASEVRRIGVAISAEDVSDFLAESKIRDTYLGEYCVFRGFQPDSVKKYIGSLKEFYVFLLGRKKELKRQFGVKVSTEAIIKIQNKLERWKKTYKKASNRRFWQRQMEDYQVLVDDKQIQIYNNSSFCAESKQLFEELSHSVRNVTRREFCVMRDSLFVIIELANAHRSGVCSNFTIPEYKKMTCKDGYHMFFVEKHKTADTYGPAVVALSQTEFRYLEIFVSKVRPQVHPTDINVFVSWNGKMMASGAISRQLCSVWIQIGILKDADKNLSCNILRKSASTNVREAADPRKTEVADMMAHSNKTAEIHYYIRKKQLSAASGTTALRQINNQRTCHSDPVILKDQVNTPVASPNRKKWESKETEFLRSILTDQIQCGSVTKEEIRDKRSELEAIEASERQLYDKARSLVKSANRTVSQKRFSFFYEQLNP